MATRAKPREIVIESQKVFGVINKGLKWIGIVIAIATVVLAVILSIDGTLFWTTNSSSSSCVAGHPCILSSNDDGSSNVVEVKKGQVACFEPGTWSRLEELGLMISYQAAGIPERPFPCSLKEVYGGSCTATYDHFSFKPRHKIPLPNYWFVASGSKQC